MGRALGEFTVLAIDVNFLTGFDDVKPSRFEAIRGAALRAAEVLLQRGAWVSVLIFHRRAYPLLFFTRDSTLVTEVIRGLRHGERGVSLGDALKEASFLLLSAPPGYATRVIVFSSGGFRLGPPVEPITVFMRSAGIIADIVTVSRSGPVAADVEIISRITSYTGGVWEHASSREEAIAKAELIARREVGVKRGRVWRPGLGLYPPRQLYTRA